MNKMVFLFFSRDLYLKISYVDKKSGQILKLDNFIKG
jgi:hypothetical protein